MADISVIIDGNSLLYRAFFALPASMKKNDSTPTNAVYGFMTMLLRAVEEYHPNHLAVAFDLKGKTFRHSMYEDYKAGRAATPDDLIVQFDVLKKALEGLGVSWIGLESYEADDILGTFAKMGDENGYTTYLITGDRDALQLISDNTSVVITKKGVTETELFDKAHLGEVYGLVPSQIRDLKALMGDSSDNIPGIAGVGEKTALKLLKDYPTVEELYENTEVLPKNKLREKLINGRDSAFLSKTLATINTSVPIKETLDDIEFAGFENEKLKEVFSDLEFFSLLKRFDIKKEQKKIETVEITSAEQLKTIAQGFKEKAGIYMDKEALYIADDDSAEYRAAFSVSLFGEGISQTDALSALKDFLGDDKVKKYTHGAKELMHACDAEGIQLRGLEFDCEIAAYVLDPTRRNFSQEKLCELYSEGGHACALLGIAEKQREEISKNELERVFYDIEMPLVTVLFDMERQGFKVDVKRLKELRDVYSGRIEELTRSIYELCGEEFNIASTKQLGIVLFEHMGLPAKKKTKTGYSTDIEVLESLEDKHPVIPLIIEYRQVTKIKSTYIDGLIAVAGGDGRIHTTFNQTATATGRISSIEPNLQNIPVRKDVNREIREVFLPSDDASLLVSADYSQIELRVLAHIAQDENMRDAFIHNEDIHLRTAAEVFGVPKEEVTPEMRSGAKAVNFGIVYGISDFGLAKNLGIPRYVAADYIKRYLEEFGGVRNYMHDVVEKAKEDGFVRTLFGRIRYISELKASNYNTRSFGERAAMNTPIQGTAADIIKYAMICVHNALKNEKLRSKLILQVHDELIIDTVPEEKEQVSELLRKAMENACTMDVPLKVNVSAGKNWAEAK